MIFTNVRINEVEIEFTINYRRTVNLNFSKLNCPYLLLGIFLILLDRSFEILRKLEIFKLWKILSSQIRFLNIFSGFCAPVFLQIAPFAKNLYIVLKFGRVTSQWLYSSRGPFSGGIKNFFQSDVFRWTRFLASQIDRTLRPTLNSARDQNFRPQFRSGAPAKIQSFEPLQYFPAFPLGPSLFASLPDKIYIPFRDTSLKTRQLRDRCIFDIGAFLLFSMGDNGARLFRKTFITLRVRVFVVCQKPKLHNGPRWLMPVFSDDELQRLDPFVFGVFAWLLSRFLLSDAYFDIPAVLPEGKIIDLW